MKHVSNQKNSRTYDELLRENLALRKLLERTSGRVNHLQYLYQISQIENSKRREELLNNQKAIEMLKLQIEGLKNSTCWRITAPLRKISDLLGGK